MIAVARQCATVWGVQSDASVCRMQAMSSVLMFSDQGARARGAGLLAGYARSGALCTAALNSKRSVTFAGTPCIAESEHAATTDSN